MYPISSELIKAIESDRLSNAEQHRVVSQMNGSSGFGQALIRIALSIVKR